jgi:cell division protein FtsB
MFSFENLKDENYYLDSQNDELRAQIEELEDRLNS